HDPTTVRDRAVGDRELERIGLEVTLPDGEVDVVAGRPRPVGEVLAEQPVAPGGRWHEATELPRKVDPRGVPEAEPPSPFLDDVAALLVGEEPEPVEE